MPEFLKRFFLVAGSFFFLKGLILGNLSVTFCIGLGIYLGLILFCVLDNLFLKPDRDKFWSQARENYQKGYEAGLKDAEKNYAGRILL